MAKPKTVGYIVVGGTETPLIWFEKYGQFLVLLGGAQNATYFRREDYELARRLIGRHNRMINEKWDLYKNSPSLRDHLTGLKIVRLTGVTK